LDSYPRSQNQRPDLRRPTFRKSDYQIDRLIISIEVGGDLGSIRDEFQAKYAAGPALIRLSDRAPHPAAAFQFPLKNPSAMHACF
jgi:hypothetical protein